MATPQTIYDNYVKSFGFPPKQTAHLVAYGKKSKTLIKFADARKVMANNFVSPDIPSSSKRSSKRSSNRFHQRKSSKSNKINKSVISATTVIASNKSIDNKKVVKINPIISSSKSVDNNKTSRTGRGRSRSDADRDMSRSERFAHSRPRSMTNQLMRSKSRPFEVKSLRPTTPKNTKLKSPPSSSSKRSSIKP
eukprot:362072_1